MGVTAVQPSPGQRRWRRRSLRKQNEADLDEETELL